MKGFYVQGCVMICRVIRSKHISMNAVHRLVGVHLMHYLKLNLGWGAAMAYLDQHVTG